MKQSHNISFTFGINGSLRKREVQHPTQYTEYYLFNSAANLKAYSCDALDFAYYGYNASNTRAYKLSMLNTNQWVNGEPQPLSLQLQSAMFYPNAYINFNQNGEYTKHYYNGSERIASRLGDVNLSIAFDYDDMLETHRAQIEERFRLDMQALLNEEVPVDNLSMLDVSSLQQTGNPTDVFYYHPNHLGSTAFVTDENATVTQGFLYAPFGEITTEYNANFGCDIIPKYSFNAKELDEETGMYYYEARYYKPPVFTSRDPMFEKYFWMSPYAYCANNPVKYVDPSGEAVIPTNNLKSNASVYAFFSVAENNSAFKTVMHRFYSNQSNVYIHLSQLMKNGSPSGRQNIARTESAKSKNNPVGKYGIERIIINSDILDKSGNISGDLTFVFNALLHEGLHAKQYDTRQSDRDFSNYPGYKDFILDRPEEGGHHNQMGAFNRQLLIDGMKEFDSQMGTSHSNEWYEAISWTGLRTTTAWKNFKKSNPDLAKRYVKIIQNEINKLGE